MALFAFIALVMTTISIIRWPNGIKRSVDHDCTAKGEVENIILMRSLNIAFMIACSISIMYLLMFACCINRQSKGKYKNLCNCHRCGSSTAFLRISSILGMIMWLGLTILCYLRFIYFMTGLQSKCKQFIINQQTILFLSIIGNAVFAIFMSIIIWISLLSYVWLAIIVFLMMIHLALLFLFYLLGWNYMIHIINESLMLSSKDVIEEGEFRDHCLTRYIFVMIIFIAFISYFIIGFVELYFNIKMVKNKPKRMIKITKKPKKPKNNDNANDKLLGDNSKRKYTKLKYDNKYDNMCNNYDHVNKSVEYSKHNKCFKWIRKIRMFFMSLLYLSAIVHYIIFNIIDEMTDIIDSCSNSYKNLEPATYYSKRMENIFIFVMIADLIFFGKLFKSWKIIFNPIFWLSKYTWNKTHNLIYCLLVLAITLCTLITFTVLLMVEDLDLFD